MTDKILEALEIGLVLARDAAYVDFIARTGLDEELMKAVEDDIEKIEAAIALYKAQINMGEYNETDGATIPKNGVIAKWLASDEGKEAIKKSLADSAETIAILNKARKVTFEQLNTPMGLTALPPAPILSDDEIMSFKIAIENLDNCCVPINAAAMRAILKKVTK